MEFLIFIIVCAIVIGIGAIPVYFWNRALSGPRRPAAEANSTMTDDTYFGYRVVTPLTAREYGGWFFRVAAQGRVFGIFLNNDKSFNGAVTYQSGRLDGYSVMTERNRMYVALADLGRRVGESMTEAGTDAIPHADFDRRAEIANALAIAEQASANIAAAQKTLNELHILHHGRPLSQ